MPQDARVAVFIAAYDSDADIIAKNRGEFRRRRELSLYIERDKTAAATTWFRRTRSGSQLHGCDDGQIEGAPGRIRRHRVAR